MDAVVSVAAVGVAVVGGGSLREAVSDIETLMARNPSRNAILLGDTVQADPEVFRRMLAKRGDRVQLVLVHEVNQRPCPPALKRDPRVVAFTDYADCARQLFAKGVINAAQLVSMSPIVPP